MSTVQFSVAADETVQAQKGISQPYLWSPMATGLDNVLH